MIDVSDHRRTLVALSDLGKNDFYESPEGVAIYHGHLVLDLCQEMGLAPCHVVPSLAGGVAIYFRAGRRAAVVECFNEDGRLTGSLGTLENSCNWWETYPSNEHLFTTLKRVEIFFQTGEDPGD